MSIVDMMSNFLAKETLSALCGLIKIIVFSIPGFAIFNPESLSKSLSAT